MSVPVESSSAAPLRRRPELLAPAGDRQCLQAAVENGADAVYFGLDCGFNARARAANLHIDELAEVMSLLHRRAVKGYVTLNTLAFTSELEQLERIVKRIAAAGADAVLVQDLGLVRLIRAVCPDLPLHASTQMTLTSAECIAAAQQLGVERVVLARELSIREIGKIHQQTTVSLETFVHGALCVAYSGQCLTSESLGGRSANRGQCAQACRLPYELVCDGEDIDLGDVKYLLSPQDLAAYALVPQLIEAGVECLKIEGRLKTPEYVANITRSYREAIDTALAGKPVRFTPRHVTEMELSFSRGFSPGWLEGCDHKMLVPGLSSAKHGVLIGQVVAVRGQRVRVALRGPIARGDGVVFAGDRAARQEQGGRVYELFRDGRPLRQTAEEGEVELAFGHEAIDTQQLSVGQQMWKTDDPQLTARLRKTFSGPDAHRRTPIDMQVRAAVGELLTVHARRAGGEAVTVASSEPLREAVKHPLTREVLQTQLGRLGGSVYALGSLEASIEGRPMVPLSVLGKLRHELIEQLDRLGDAPPKRRIADGSPLAELRAQIPRDDAQPAARPALRVLCRSLEQLQAVLACNDDAGGAAPVTGVLVDFMDIRQYRRAVEMCGAAGMEIHLATPRIQKPDEAGIFRAMEKHGADGLLVRNLAGLRYFAERGAAIVADFSLNAANELTVDYLRRQGAGRVTVCYDLNREQLLELVGAVPSSWLEVVIHQHMPMFHMEHCVFCAVLSPGTNKTNCGRPCDEHQVKLRDRIGMEHPLTADVACRNTLFNAVPQSAAEAVPALLERGVRNFRIELLEDSADELRTTILLYRELLAGRITGKQVWQRLQASNRVGVTRGTLEQRRNPLAIL
ncbi:MAG: DUF3656 domain-containing protein [Pirellulaceae bacterium]